MHYSILKDATDEQLRSFLQGELDSLKSSNKEMHDKIEEDLYEAVYGPHFNAITYEKAVSGMRNSDGSDGAYWKIDDVKSVARNYGLKYEGFNEWDFAYAMNMAYSDYKGSIPDNVESYFKVARAFICDKDAPEGKAYLYWKAMSKKV